MTSRKNKDNYKWRNQKAAKLHRHILDNKKHKDIRNEDKNYKYKAQLHLTYTSCKKFPFSDEDMTEVP